MESLRIAILHYHLRGGGVTRIIEHTFTALNDTRIQLCVITGEKPPNGLDIPEEKVGVVKGLSYGKKNPDIGSVELKKGVVKKAKELLGSEPDIWHVHNHSLGKNAAFTRMTLKLAENGHKMVFHIHDFAEDNRAQNFTYLLKEEGVNGEKKLSNQLYPQGKHIHYVVLNGRDYNFLKETGFNKERLHLLSNPVSLSVSDNDNSEDLQNKISGKVMLYPCRAIPRKNIGELILWSALAADDEQFAVTLAPKNEKYKAGYDNWKSFVEKHKLPVVFEAGDQWNMTYPQLLKRADAFITTSIAEGFGLIYLESWLAERPLTGRLLQQVTTDFEDQGIEFPGMYSSVDIPVEWMGEETLTERLKQSISFQFEQYEITLSRNKLERWLNALLVNGTVDFGVLDQGLQQKVIEKVIEYVMKNPSAKKKMNPPQLSDGLADLTTIKKNKAIVENKFSLDTYGKHLREIYKKVDNEIPESIQFIDAESLLLKFLSPQNFSLLRS